MRHYFPGPLPRQANRKPCAVCIGPLASWILRNAWVRFTIACFMSVLDKASGSARSPFVHLCCHMVMGRDMVDTLDPSIEPIWACPRWGR
jgi:hypothetical protein